LRRKAVTAAGNVWAPQRTTAWGGRGCPAESGCGRRVVPSAGREARIASLAPAPVRRRSPTPPKPPTVGLPLSQSRSNRQETWDGSLCQLPTFAKPRLKFAGNLESRQSLQRSRMASDGHRVISSAVDTAAEFRFLHAAPLLKEEGDFGAAALVADGEIPETWDCACGGADGRLACPPECAYWYSICYYVPVGLRTASLAGSGPLVVRDAWAGRFVAINPGSAAINLSLTMRIGDGLDATSEADRGWAPQSGRR